MPDIEVPDDERPAIWTYVGWTAAGFVLVAILVGGAVSGSDSATLAFDAGIVAMVVNLAILFAMVESFLAAWFDAAEVTEA
ncbi:MAG: hypothetical protein ABEJ08_02625 [Halobacteriaceae archaeon]